MRLAMAACCLCSETALATTREWHLLEPRDVYIDTYRNEVVHDPYIYPEDQYLTYGSTFNIDANLLKWGPYGLYWLNQLHFDQSGQDGRIKHAGWQYELGLTVWVDKYDNPRIELFKQHHSRHVLDEYREEHFPVYDRVGVRFRLIP